MIFNKNFNMGDIVVIKLISSEEIICKLLELTENYVKISKPITLNFTGNPISKEGGLIPLPWSLSIEENANIELKKDCIMFISKPRKEIQSMYLQITSNIVLPREGILKDVNDRR